MRGGRVGRIAFVLGVGVVVGGGEVGKFLLVGVIEEVLLEVELVFAHTRFLFILL